MDIQMAKKIALALVLAVWVFFEGAFLYDIFSDPDRVDPAAARIMWGILFIGLFLIGRWYYRRSRGLQRQP
jgi:hypothetical protein